MIPCALPQLGLPDVAPPALVATAGGEKQEREALGAFPEALASTNFVLKWGEAGAVTEDAATSVLADLERAWATEVGDLGFPAPPGADQYKINVYVGDSGGDAPSSYGAAGYYTRDDEGYGYLVLARATLGADWQETTTAHELFHALQDGTGSYGYRDLSAWYWEATAMWVEGRVYPDDPDYYAFLFGYGLFPELPIWHHESFDAGELTAYHPYGAFVWPWFLTEHVADEALVRESWVAPPADTPQGSLDALLAARGLDVGEAYGAFTAANVLWEYRDGEAMARHVEDYERGYRESRLGDEASGAVDWRVPSPSPAAWGSSLVGWRGEAGRWRFEIEAESEGSAGSLARFAVTLVGEGADGPWHREVPLTEAGGAAAGTLETEISWEDVDVHLVLAVLADDVTGASLPDDETWGWRYRVTAVDELPFETGADTGGGTDGPETAACGCAAAGPGGGWLSAVLAIGLRLSASRSSSGPRPTRRDRTRTGR